MSVRIFFRCASMLLLVAWFDARLANAIQTQNSDTIEQARFFESRIRPILVERCYSCHSQETRQEGALVLDSSEGLLRGGDRGAALTAGAPDSSLLVRAVRWTDAEMQMPPEDAGGKLTDRQIADLETWIATGAYDPRTESTATNLKSWDEKYRERLNWWSLKPLQRHALPEIPDADWNRSIPDRFLRAAMMEQAIAPSPFTDARTLVRRATLVLTGLPPSIDEVESFVADASTDLAGAYERRIDQLLNSTAFGERFAKHWLDVVRFTETHGNEWNYDVPYAYRYRDYMIRALNSDIPFRQLVQEHIAGDLLEHPRWNEQGRFNESMIGTAFYRFGEVNHDSCTQFAVIGYDLADNQVDTLTKAFQATTVSCARCHDHKLDAISTQDYHAILAIIRSSRSVQHTIDAPAVNRDSLAQLEALKRDIRRELAKVWEGAIPQIDASRLNRLLEPMREKPPAIDHPLYAWRVANEDANPPRSLQETWKEYLSQVRKESQERAEFNRTRFQTIADFRDGIPAGWQRDGLGLRAGSSGAASSTENVDYLVAHEGSEAIKRLVSRGTFSSTLSDKMNAALRSPTLARSGSKLSFEVVGGGFSLARIVFNNCQLNYTQQHSIHHPDWSWVTIDFPEGTQELFPYAELLTYWDNPKFPDPLGTLGKDIENQRQPFREHSKNPRTWWGVRRIVSHNEVDVPKSEWAYLAALINRDCPCDLDALASYYRAIASDCVRAFADNTANEDQVYWLNWCIQSGLLENRRDASPQLEALVDQYRAIEIHQLTLPTTMPGMADETDGFDQPVLLRGDYKQPSELVPRRYLQALDPQQESIVRRGSGRSMLADQIASDRNPLTARVITNRVWQWVFGNGLVRTPDDFGHLGDTPSHPELLDRLTIDFIESDWSIKKLVRTLVLSRAFQASSRSTEGARALDPRNRLLSYYPPHRADAEVIRDSILACSKRLDRTLYGPSIHPYREQAEPDKRLYTGSLDGEGRRSIYLKFQLMESPRFLSAFNLPGGKSVQGKRDVSNVPAQSLALLNDPFVWAMSEHWANGILQNEPNAGFEHRIQRMLSEALGRPATSIEEARFKDLAHQLSKEHHVDEAQLMTSLPVWRDIAHTMFNLKEFIYIH